MSLFSILVDIAAQTASFESGMKRVESQLEDFGENVKQAMEFAGIATSLHELVSQFDEFVEHAVSVEHATQKIGIAAEDFSKLEFAAKQTGVATDQLTTGLEKFAKSAAMAAGGSKEQSAAFEAMGVAVKDSNGNLRPMTALLDDVADKFASYQDGAGKAALAQMLFGRAGADLIPLLDEGSRGIEEYGKRHKELGGVLTESSVKSAEAFERKMNEVHDILSGAWQSIATQLLPALTALADYFVKTGTAAGGFTAKIQPMVTALKFLTDVAFSVERTFADLGDAIGALMAMGVALAKGHFSEAKAIWKDYQDQAAASEKAGNEFLKKLWDDAGTSLDSLGEKAEENSKRMAAPIVNLGQETKSLKDMLDEVIQNIDKASHSRIGGAASVDFGNQAAREAGKQIEDLHDRLMRIKIDLKDAATDWTAPAQQAAQNIQSAFANFLFDPFKSGVRGMAIEFINIIRRMVTEALAAQLMKALFGDSKNGSNTSGLGGTLATFFGSFFGGGKASGGPVSAGTTYLVGEDGPELFTPGASGGITPNGALGGGGMTFNPTYNIDARGADETRIMTMLPPVLYQHAQQVKYEVLHAFRRSGLPAPLRA